MSISSPENQPVTVEVSDLSRRFGRRWAVARATFSLPPGGSCMITGAIGSGKTTLLRCIATALRPDHGTIRLDGVDLWPNRRKIRKDIAFLSHATRLYEDLDASANLQTWAQLGGYSVDHPELLARVGLPIDRKEPVKTFSAGMRRRLALARVLLKRPRLLLLDEPFTALDPEGRALVIEIVRDLQASGTALLVATHLPDVAAELCSQRIHMEAGAIIRNEASA